MRYVLVGIASLGGLLFGYETGVAAGALQWAQFTWTNTLDDQLLLSTGTLLGAVIGALAAGRIADMVGRRDVIMSTTALFTLGALVSAIAPSGLLLLVGRLVVGVGVGAISVAAPLYIAEIAPTARRGAMIGIFALMVATGILLAYIGLEALVNRPDGWRFLLGAGAVPGLILSGLALLLVESPVWLALKGDQQAAAAVQARLGADCSGQDIDTIGARADEHRPDDLSQVFSLAGRGAIFIGIGLFFVQQFVGINAMVYYSTASLSKLEQTLSFGGLQDGPGLSLAATNVVATLVAVALIDRVGRRRLLLLSLAGVAAGLVVMAVGASLHTAGGAQFLSAAGLYVFVVSFAVGLGPIAWVVAAEMLPVHVRGLAMGVVVGAHWLFDSLASPTGLLLRDEVGRPVLLAMYAGFAVAGIVLFRKLPETKGLSLAAIDRYFTNWATRVKDSRFVAYAVTTLATMGGLLTGYNFGITAVTLVLIADDWKLNAFEQGVVASVLVAGLAAGSFVAGPLSDRFGRRYVLMSMAALFVASAFGAALAPSLGWLLFARAAAGVAIGVTSPTAGLYVAEIAPAVIRGRLLSFEAVAYGLGTILAYCVGLALEEQPNGWRLMFGFIAVPSTIYGLALLPLPESPRWLAAAGQLNAARRSLVRLFGLDADRQLAAITAERPASDDGGTPGSWARLWQPTYRPAVWVGLALMFLMVFSGWDMVLFYAPTILKEIGFNDTTVSFAATLGLGIVFLVMTLISLAIIDRAGRKPMVVTGLFVMAACLLVMAALTLGPLASSPVARWGQVASLAVFVGAFALTLGAVGEIVVAEIYPQSIRGPASSLSHGTRSLFAIVFTLTFPLLLDVPGLTVTLLGYAVISIVGALYLLRALPETKGRSLEDIGEYWNRRARARAAAEVSVQ